MNERDPRHKYSHSFRNTDGWWSRGYLPHFDASNLMHFVTVRLADSLPQCVHAALRKELAHLKATSTNNVDLGQVRQLRLEKIIDAGHGSCVLRRPEVSCVVIESMQFLCAQGHTIARWVIMPNHLHLLITVHPARRLSSVLRSFKGFTAQRANQVLGTSGPFWFPEYFDRYIRDAEHYSRAVRYIDTNPVRAGLVENAADWKLGSAGWRPVTPVTPQPPRTAELPLRQL
jgi:putative DNA methylase